MQKNKKQLFFYVLTTIIILTSIIGYKIGYRITGPVSIGKVGILEANIPLADTTIFVGDNKKITTTKEDEIVKLKLSPKENYIIISKKDYYPWTKKVNIPSRGYIKISPFFVPQNPSGFIIGKADPEYYKIKNEIFKNILPEKNKPIISIDGKSELWIEDGAIIVKLNDIIFNVLKPESDIRNVNFYKNRNDIVIFSTSDSVYVIEVDKPGSQNFMPIYKGQNPRFVTTNENYIYVEDTGSLMQVMI